MHFALAVALAVATLATACVETEGFAPARQGETVAVEGGRLTALRWCGSATCPGGIAGRAVIWVRACATTDDWEVSEADFLVLVRSTEDSYYAESIPRREAFGHHTLEAGACADGTLSFTLPERPEYLFYYGSGFRVRWEIAARPAGGTGFRPIGPAGWNVALDPAPAGAAVPRAAASTLPCKARGIRYVGTAPADTFVCLTLSADGSHVREVSWAFGAESQCPDEKVGTTHIVFNVDRPKVAANGRFRIDDRSILFTGAVHGATAAGTFGERAICGTKRFGWRARRTG
jgi:hypothetical protein